MAAVIFGSAFAYFIYAMDTPSQSGANIASAPLPAASTQALSTNSPWRIQENVPTWKEAPKGKPAPAPDPERDNDPTRDLSSYLPFGSKPKMAEVIDGLHQAGIHTGLGAFNPPGTRPPMIGLAVPEDMALPPGYVRHYQATDDGQRIEPILMFAPDFQLLDAQKQPIPMPKNRVVPPELAPPGFPKRPIVIPPPVESGPSGP